MDQNTLHIIIVTPDDLLVRVFPSNGFEIGPASKFGLLGDLDYLPRCARVPGAAGATEQKRSALRGSRCE